jgi:hypothetical protein
MSLPAPGTYTAAQLAAMRPSLSECIRQTTQATGWRRQVLQMVVTHRIREAQEDPS